MASFTVAESLSAAVSNTIAFLTRPLVVCYPASTVIKLQYELEASLFDLYAPSWVPTEPLRGSGRRCLTLAPGSLPPRAIYNACMAASVQWAQWMTLLGGEEFDLFVDPGRVSVRLTTGELATIWSDVQAKADLASQARTQVQALIKAQRAAAKSLAQQLLEEDTQADDELFAMIDDELRAPTWLTPMLDKFPIVPEVPRSVSPESAVSTHSRCSSFSSLSSASSSGMSFSSVETIDSYDSAASCSSTGSGKQSRRERARLARVFIDTAKTEVTPYDGGKTTVLTGGVMLGAKPAAPKTHKPAQSSTSSWRSFRA